MPASPSPHPFPLPHSRPRRRAKRVQMMKILYRSKKFLVFISSCVTLYGAAY
ncbi:hypothetical protein HMPREF3190_01644 [Umbribacter vaginalis]|nr:hypothetical protein HMPREF3190_01644 [Coriobacteriales bacterium DNF00809]